MTAYSGQTWMTLGQLCAAQWDGFKAAWIRIRVSVATPQALSALDHCATREPKMLDSNFQADLSQNCNLATQEHSMTSW